MAEKVQTNELYLGVIIKSILKTHKAIALVHKLQNDIWNQSSDLETHTVETHIYRLRKKINDKFNDKNFITSHDEGYLI